MHIPETLWNQLETDQEQAKQLRLEDTPSDLQNIRRKSKLQILLGEDHMRKMAPHGLYRTGSKMQFLQ